MECRSVFPRVYRIREVAEILGVSRESARRLLNETKGIIRIGHAETLTKRRYFSPRITEPQLKALIARLSA